MKEFLKRERKPLIIISAFAFGIVLILFFLRLSVVQVAHPVLLCACDALTITGLIYLIWSVVSLFISKGGLDALFYIARLAANVFASDRTLAGKPRFVSYHKFLSTIEHKPSRCKLFLFVGSISFVIGIILFLIYGSIG